MKYYLVVLIFSIFNVALGRLHNTRSLLKTNNKQIPEKNKYFKLFTAVISTVTKVNHDGIKTLNECIPNKWKFPNNNQDGTSDGADAEGKTEIKAILKKVNLVTEFMCKFKEKFVKLFPTIGNPATKKKRKIFLQIKLSAKQNKMVEKFWSNIKVNLKNTWKKAKIKGTIATALDWSKVTWNKCVKFAGRLAKNLMTFWSNFKLRAPKYFKIVDEKLEKISTCYGKYKLAIVSIKTLFLAMVKRSPEIKEIVNGDIGALSKLFINLLCNLTIFKRAFNSLAESLTKNDNLKKYELYGVFTGEVFTIIFG